jgi:hypothetical protein
VGSERPSARQQTLVGRKALTKNRRPPRTCVTPIAAPDGEIADPAEPKARAKENERFVRKRKSAGRHVRAAISAQNTVRAGFLHDRGANVSKCSVRDGKTRGNGNDRMGEKKKKIHLNDKQTNHGLPVRESRC